jgi:DNA-directed RNA polymerase specialized sigma24 family protein
VLVSRASRRFGLSNEDARDIVQDAFVIALVKLDIAQNPKAWLMRVVDHLSANLRRKARRREELVARWFPESSGGLENQP